MRLSKLNDQINPYAGNHRPCNANMMGVQCEGHNEQNFHVGKFLSHKGNGYCYITWKYESHLENTVEKVQLSTKYRKYNPFNENISQ